MSLLNRLEARWGRFAIPNLTLVIIAGQALLYLLTFLPGGIHLENLTCDPAKIAEGEVWRLLTFLFMPPFTRFPIFAIFAFLILNLFGTAVEHHLGRFRYNLYFLLGWFFNVAAGFASSAIVGSMQAGKFSFAPGDVSNHSLELCLFLGFARLYPEFVIYIAFVLPVKIRWLAWLTWAMIVLRVATGGWYEALPALASVANYLLFFGMGHLREARSAHRKIKFEAKARSALKPPRHECRVCGLDSDESPRTLFRYCSKCAGQACYCPAHIRDHEHVTEADKEKRT